MRITNYELQITNYGQTLIEAVVVMSVGIIVVGALVFATIASLRNSQAAKNQAQATKLAQEGLEIIRTGRDRVAAVPIQGCSPSACVSWAAADSLWTTRLNSSGGVCDNSLPQYCYLKLSSVNPEDLTWIAASAAIPSGGEQIENFTRYIILSDDANFDKWKTVTSLIIWTDFAGTHESRVSTVLRKL